LAEVVIVAVAVSYEADEDGGRLGDRSGIVTEAVIVFSPVPLIGGKA
jgi:hypothetical protein